MILILPLEDDALDLVDARLPLSRLGNPGGGYLVAWEEDEPLGHAFVDWSREPPELQDVYVAEAHRRRGVAKALSGEAERRAREDGHTLLALEVSVDNVAARSLYESLGYAATGSTRRVKGTILIRGEPLEVDDTLLAMVKSLA